MAAAMGEGFRCGVQISLLTSLGEKLDGEIVEYDSTTNCVVLQDIGGRGPKRNVRFLRTEFIDSFQVVGEADPPSLLPFPHFDLNVLRAKEEAAIRRAEAEVERFGVDVTEEAQHIFDALSKTMPVHWEQRTIVVMNEVKVTSPYLPENVIGGQATANERVRIVLRKERERLAARTSLS